MNKYTIDEINLCCLENPKEFILSCEDSYTRKVDDAATSIKRRLSDSPIVLISGPSSSGKTTTARRIQSRLTDLGVITHTISMDDYYKDRDGYVMPLDDNGKPDLESPYCIDLPLLRDHLVKLAAGELIQVPKFDFERQKRSEETEPIQLKYGELAIIEGIHALNDIITGELNGNSTSIYISVGSEVLLDETHRLEPYMLRFARRAIRDRNFRGASIKQTLELWRTVMRGEGLYIKPFLHNASIFINTYMPYESCILMNMLKNEVTALKSLMKQAGLLEVYYAMGEFEPIDYAPHIPVNSLLHEFIG